MGQYGQKQRKNRFFDRCDQTKTEEKSTTWSTRAKNKENIDFLTPFVVTSKIFSSMNKGVVSFFETTPLPNTNWTECKVNLQAL
jgi:hypothetical protein